MRTSLAEEPSAVTAEEIPALDVDKLVAGYAGAPVVRSVSLSVRQGQVVSVLGPNGAGKSTLLKAILGLVRVVEGTVNIEGVTVTNRPAEELVRNGLGYVPQVRDVFESLSVLENLEVGGHLLDRGLMHERLELVTSTFPMLTTMAHRRAGALSGGERKILAMGRVMMRQPRILILDEPTAGLAPAISRTFLEEHVPQIARLGAAILLVEQRAMAALEVSDHGYVLVSGEVRKSGPAAALRGDEEVGRLFLGHHTTTSVGISPPSDR